MNIFPAAGAGSVLGALLQFLRQKNSFPEWAYLLVTAGAACFITWATGTDLTAFVGPDRASAWFRAGAVFLSALGGTQGLSSAAYVATQINPSLAKSNLVPVTNSKP